MPGGRAPTAATVPAAQRCDGCASRTSCAPARQGTVERDGCRRLSAVGEKSCACALCPGRGPGRTEHCRIRHRTRRGQSFRRRAATPGLRRECALVITNVLLVASVAAFYLPPLPLWGALACLAAWGASWGRRPVSHHGAGQPLGPRQGRGAGGGGMNNLSILSFLPLAATLLAQGKPTLAATVFLAGLGLGAVLTVHDAVRANRRSSWLAPKKADAEPQCQRAGSSRFSSARANKRLSSEYELSL